MKIAAPWLEAPETRRVLAALETARPGGSRFVGGCVRNAVLGAPVDDIDIATQLLPQETIAAAEAAGLAAVPTGIEHGTVTLISAHKPFEVTTLRRDVATDGRRATVAFTQDWAEDAARRDFRLNALYADPDGEVHDPTGGGLDDAAAGRIVFIGDAEARIREDYLRILRFFRFHAWYGKGALDAAGLRGCTALAEGLKTLSAERIWKELKKTLAARDPRPALAGLIDTGAWRLSAPEATRTERLISMVALEVELLLDLDPMRRLAAACPDAAAGRALSRRLKTSREEADRLEDALGAMPPLSSEMTPADVRAAVYRLGKIAFADRARIAWAERPAADASGWRAALALAETWTAPKFPLTGEDALALGAPPGPKLGAALRAVEAWWVESDFVADRAALLQRLAAAL